MLALSTEEGKKIGDFLSRRAMCFIGQEKYHQAAVYATVSIFLSHGTAESHHTRCTALMKLGFLDEALQALEYAPADERILDLHDQIQYARANGEQFVSDKDRRKELVARWR